MYDNISWTIILGQGMPGLDSGSSLVLCDVHFLDSLPMQSAFLVRPGGDFLPFLSFEPE